MIIEENEKFDIFIAYHGDRSTGSEAIAEKIYNKINGHAMSNGRKIRAYFKPKTSPYGNFAETPRIVARTPLLLLVINKNIPRNNSGQMAETSEKGILKYLYQEIEAFRESDHYKRAEKGTAAKLLIGDDFSFEEAGKLDPMFSGTPAFRFTGDEVFRQIEDWIEDRILKKECPVIDWTKERAQTWEKMQPPSRPAHSELEIYSKYFKIAKNKKVGAERPKALILGSTVEFRMLAMEEGFDVIVVDYSKEYYEAISKSLNKTYDISKERLVECDWCTMGEKLKDEKFDIIIGDLAVGNIPPKQLQDLIKNINDLLSPTGYWLGKSIYIFSDVQITNAEMNAQLENVSEDPKVNSDNIYQIVMYPLSICAGKKYPTNDDSGNVYKMDFEALYSFVKDFADRLTDDDARGKFKIYLDEATEFDKKMPKNFYIYSYLHFLDEIERGDLMLEDTAYSKEKYKDDFPLLIIKKCTSDGNHDFSIGKFLSNLNDEPCWETWKSVITSQYFLWELKKFTGIDKDDMIVRIKNLFNAESQGTLFKVADDLNCYIDKIPEASLAKETQTLVNGTNLEKNDKLIQELQLNYTLGLLINIVYQCNSKANLLNLLLRTLFKKKDQGKLWEPYKSPWLSARICICLFPLYVQWSKKANRIQEEQKQEIERVIDMITNINIEDRSNNYFWNSNTSNHFDTSALCLEALNLYYSKINNNAIKEKIEKKINGILDRHVRKNKIKETFIKFPIYKELIDEVCAKHEINGDPAHKKLCGRIQWYSIIYKICQEWGENDNELLGASVYIAKELRRFWSAFIEKSKKIIDATIDQEKSLVPQIIYCLNRTGLFGKEN